jgi:signal transduction histidine kinase
VRHGGVRILLLSAVAGIAAAVAAALLGLGLPLLAARALDAPRFALLVTVAALTVVGVGTFVLFRLVARPIERLLHAADRLGTAAPGELPPLGDGAAGLSSAALAFERVAGALAVERAALARKVAELTEANAQLAQARESLLRTERLAAVGRLAAGLAHEVGNPLGAISGYAELARTRMPAGAPRELVEAVDRIAAAAARIDGTVRELLDFARPAAAPPQPVQLREVVEVAVGLARAQARFGGAEVAVEIPPELPRVMGTERQLTQLLLNLLLNAGDAMQGGGRVTVRARPTPGGVTIDVDDTGPGIPAENLSRIFDPFFTTKDVGHGTGLGLAVCHGIVTACGGEIGASDAPGGGARFTVRLLAAAREGGP